MTRALLDLMYHHDREERFVSNSEEQRDQAEIERQRASDAYARAESELENAQELLERLEQEDLDSQKPSATRERAIQVVDSEIAGLRQDLAEAEDSLHRAISRWAELNG